MAVVTDVGTNTAPGVGQYYTLDATNEFTPLHDVSDGLAGGVVIQVKGTTLTATLTPQVTLDGTNYATAVITDLSDGSTDTSITGDGIWRCDLSGGLKFRLYATSVGAGSARVSINTYLG